MDKITNSKLQITNKSQYQMSKITNWIPASAGMTINIIVFNFGFWSLVLIWNLML